MFRVGFGQDSHPFEKNSEKKLVLGGVEVEGEVGLEGKSDGDVVIHALCNALEQAIGGESLSTYSDPMAVDGILDSREYLKVAKSHIIEEGYKINNIGISIEAKKPKINPITSEMKKSLASVLKINESLIGINSTSGEELNAFGRGEGIQVFAIVSLIEDNG